MTQQASTPWPQTLIGVGVLLTGLALAAGALTIPSAAGYGGVGPNFLPWVCAVVLAICGAYFVWFWRNGGQTLPMKTWHIKVVTHSGAKLSWTVAIKRYLYAVAGSFALGITYFWAIFDRDRQFLHDRVAGTRIVRDRDQMAVR